MASTETHPTDRNRTTAPRASAPYRLSGDRLVDAVEPIPARTGSAGAPQKSLGPSLGAQVAHEVVNIVGWSILSVLAVITTLGTAGAAGLAGYCLWTAAGIESFTRDYYLYGGAGLGLLALLIGALVLLFRAGREPKPPVFRGDILV